MLHKKKMIFVIATVMMFVMMPALMAEAKGKPKLTTKSKTMTVGTSSSITLKNAGKTKWKTSNKNVVAISKVKKNKVIIKAKKKGKATITATYKKKKYKITIMGKKINVDASDDPCMFQFFKQFVHQTDKNEFYCDGEYAYLGNPGVEVDFRNVDHTYEVFALLGNYWGGWNSTPTAGEMYDITKKWEDRFGAEIIGLSYDSIDF